MRGWGEDWRQSSCLERGWWECSCFSSESRFCWGVGSEEGGKFAKMGKEELEKGGVCWNVRKSYQKPRPDFMEI